MAYDPNNPYVNQDLTPDDLMEIQEKVNLGKASAEQRELFGKYMRRRLEQLERMAGNAVYDSTVPDSYFRALSAGIREIRYWEQSLLVNETKGSRLSVWLDKMLKKLKNKNEVKT